MTLTVMYCLISSVIINLNVVLLACDLIGLMIYDTCSGKGIGVFTPCALFLSYQLKMITQTVLTGIALLTLQLV